MSDFTITGEDAKNSQPPLAQAETLIGTFTPTGIPVALQAAGSDVPQTALWSSIRTRARWMAYPIFEQVVEKVFKCPKPKNRHQPKDHAIAGAVAADQKMQDTIGSSENPFGCYHGADAYGQLKATAETFLALLCNPEEVGDAKGAFVSSEKENHDNETRRNPDIDWKKLTEFLSPSSYPYLKNIKTGLSELVNDNKILCDGFRTCFCPMELIWSYWHEEGMLVQTLNAICLRFQNRRGPNPHDPLANLQLNPLRPLSTLLWGYIQDEHNRLTVARRAYEYDHEYGLRLMGRAVSDIQTVDHRSKFLEAFHNLLYVATRFYREADNTTIRADAFPLLNALKELHLVLAQGAQNQFGDLPWAARVEMLIQKWLLARPEIREFLGGAPMVPYKESWMAHADSMKTLQGWTDVPVSHFSDLGVYGEQLLLSVRYQEWINIDDPGHAYNWAAYWRPEIQSYIHAYHAVTGVDVSAEITDTRRAAERNIQPAIHQMRRLQMQRNGGNGLSGTRDRDGMVYRR